MINNNKSAAYADVAHKYILTLHGVQVQPQSH